MAIRASFHMLCQELQDEHERVVEELQAQISLLTKQGGVEGDREVSPVKAGNNQMDMAVFLGDDVVDEDDDQENGAHGNSKNQTCDDAGKSPSQSHHFSTMTGTMNDLGDEDGDPETKQLLALWPKRLDRWCCSRQSIYQWWSWWSKLEEPQRSGFLARFIRTGYFQWFILSVILANTFFIIWASDQHMEKSFDDFGANTQANACSTGEKDLFFTDASFMFVYTIELILKITVHRLYFFSHGDWRWNCFDAFLVATSTVNFIVDMSTNAVCEDGNSNLTFLRALRVLKSLRVLRMLRVVRFVRELRLMLDCIVNSMLHLVWCVVLIGMMLLMFSLYLMQGLSTFYAKATDAHRETIEDRFNTVANTMVSLLMATTGGEDWSDQYDLFSQAGSSMRMVYLFYQLFFIMVAWNIVMSSFVEKACRLGMPDIEDTAMQKYRQQQAYVKELSSMLTKKLDSDGDGNLGLEEFKQNLADKEVAAFCMARDINITDVDMFFHMLSANGTDTVDIKTFARAIVRLRGNASAIDMQSLHFDVKSGQLQTSDRLMRLEEQIDTLRQSLPAAAADAARKSMRISRPADDGNIPVTKLEEMIDMLSLEKRRSILAGENGRSCDAPNGPPGSAGRVDRMFTL